MYGSGVNLHYPLDELVAQAERWVAAGFDAVKVKVGKPDLDEDLERVAAVREVLGPDRRLMIDANQRWTLAQAERAIGELAGFDLAWIEEPLRADDLAGHVDAAPTHRGADRPRREPAHPLPLRRVHRRGRRRLVQPNIVRVGGITPFRSIAALADDRRIDLAPHLLLELSGAARARPCRATTWWSPSRTPPSSASARSRLPRPSRWRATGCAPRGSLDSASASPNPERMPRHPPTTTRRNHDDHRHLRRARPSTRSPARPRAAFAATVASTAAERAAWLTAVADALDARGRRARPARRRGVAPRHRAPHGRARPHDRAAAAVRRGDRRGLLPRGDDRPPESGDHPAATRPAADAPAARSRRRVQRLELPVRVLGRGRRHRVGARRRMPRHRQGALGAPAALAPHRRDRARGARRGGRTRRDLRPRRGPRDRRRAGAAPRGRAPSASPARCTAAGPSSTSRRRAPTRSRSTASSAR